MTAGGNEKRLRVEVVCALRDEQALIALEMEEGATVREALVRSGMLARFPDVDVVAGRVGIFGKVVGLDTALRDGDRVEMYRPLIADPKETRRGRAQRARGR